MTILFIILIRWVGVNNHDKRNLGVIVTKYVNNYTSGKWFREILYILYDLHYSKKPELFGVNI
jgi:hypothetical protein